MTKLDRLARSVRDLLDPVDRVEAKKAGLRMLAMDLDTTQPTGRRALQMLGAVAEFERNLMLERQREGIAKAKAAGKYRGRKPTVRARRAEIEELLRSGVGPQRRAGDWGSRIEHLPNRDYCRQPNDCWPAKHRCRSLRPGTPSFQTDIAASA